MTWGAKQVVILFSKHMVGWYFNDFTHLFHWSRAQVLALNICRCQSFGARTNIVLLQVCHFIVYRARFGSV